MNTRLRTATLLLLVVCGCGDLQGPMTPQTFRVTGSVVLVDRESIAHGGTGKQGVECLGLKRFVDLAPGTTVVVRDSGGSKVAAGKLGHGRLNVDLAELQSGGSAAGETRGCQLGFAIYGVPDLGRTWSLEIGDREFDFSRSEANNLRLSVG